MSTWIVHKTGLNLALFRTDEIPVLRIKYHLSGLFVVMEWASISRQFLEEYIVLQVTTEIVIFYRL